MLATAGTSVAAISFAQNAGAVDGKSAVSGTASNARAAGKLVATGKSGRVPIKFLDLKGIMRGDKATFAQGIEVVDNATSAPVGIGGAAGLGILSATCGDQDNTAGREDPQVTVTFANASGQTVNFSRENGNNPPAVSAVAAATQIEFTVNNSNTFRIYAQVGTIHYVLDGVVREDGKDSAAAVCAIYGYAMTL
ncbi:MAG: hypothetical protein ABIO51_02260 [Solirubrobacteraceae bacterium]